MSDGDIYRSRASGSYGGSGQATGYQDDHPPRGEVNWDRGFRHGPGRFQSKGRGGAPPPSRPIPTFESSAESASAPPTSSSSSYNSSIPPQNTIPNPQLNPRLLNAPYLNEFDFSICDFSTPPSWEALAASFEKTNGYVPSQEELMQIVMMVAVTSVPVDPTFKGEITSPGEHGEASQGPTSDIDGTAGGSTQVSDPAATDTNPNATSLTGQERQDDKSADEEMVDQTDVAPEDASRSSSMQMSESPEGSNH